MEKSKLLIVDDDEGVLKQLKWALLDEYEVLTASNKEDALQLAREGNPALIALDVNLQGDSSPSTGGILVLEEIKKIIPDSKVIMITGNDTKEVALEAIAKGAFDYYLKPVDVQELRIILKRALYIQKLERENRRLADELSNKSQFQEMIGSSVQMDKVFRLIKRVAPSCATTLITGESGTGKELVARAIHSLSPRRGKPFIVINCGAIPENLLESELFGHEKGAFTDAYVQKKGKLELAEKGTVFLDEIGEMGFALQVKILRFLQERVIERVGGNTAIELDVRVIAATNSDLAAKIEQEKFREDLYYRLSVINIVLPPLRERAGDILLLANYFINKYRKDIVDKNIRGLDKEAKNILSNYAWPGNVRELENRIRRALILTEGFLISPKDLGFNKDEERAFSRSLSLKQARQSLEVNLIKNALTQAKGNISLAAKTLGITRPTLYDLMKKYEIKG